tara:strand:+ start:3224 stop:5038 length:1815 start_codon:yes stop_codon:yes gene_type:complete
MTKKKEEERTFKNRRNIFRDLVDGSPISKLISQIQNDFNFKKSLHLNSTDFFGEDFKVFNNNKAEKISKTIFEINEVLSDNKTDKYQIIFGDFPFAHKECDEKQAVLNTLHLLEHDGIGVYLMPPLLRTFRSIRGKSFKNELYKRGFKVLAVIQMPDRFLKPMSGISSLLVFISKNNDIEKTYFAKYTDFDFQTKMISFGIRLLHDSNLRKELDPYNEEHAEEVERISGLGPEQVKELEEKTANLYDGIDEILDDFVSFEHWELDREINNLDSEYLGYKFVRLEELVEEEKVKIIATKDIFNDIDDSIYVPAIGRTEVIKEMPTLTSKKKPQNYFQIVCNSETILSKYLFIFLNSDLGQKTIERELSKYGDSQISRLRIKDIKNLYIPLPNLGIQEEIIENVSKLQKTQEVLNDIEKSLSIKPISSSEQLAKLNQIYNSSMELSEPEIIFNEIKKGESISREFKQTFALDIRSKKREEYIVHECVKTVAGFMNADGGTLFIGVADNADITGIEVEVGKTKLHKSLDKYLNTIKNIFKSKIGSASLTNCNFKSVKIRGRTILKVDCKKSDHHVFVDNKDTYVRMGPSTNKLEGPDLVTFSKERFS